MASDQLPRALQRLPDDDPAARERVAADVARLDPLQAALGYRFERPALLRVALTVTSWANEHPGAGWPPNATLEFFGDAVIDLLVSEALWRLLPEADEGALTRLRAGVVNAERLAALAAELDLGQWLWVGRGDARQGIRARPAVLADALEAVFGAVFLDGRVRGVDPLLGCVAPFERVFGATLAAVRLVDGLDAKSRLQQWAQGVRRATPTYRAEPRVPDGATAPVWSAVVELPAGDGALEELGSGEGPSRKRAEQQAAAAAIAALGLEDPGRTSDAVGSHTGARGHGG
jgi:ribonuclease-3